MNYRKPDQVTSPKEYVTNVEVIYDGGPDSFSLAYLTWDNQEIRSIGIRWNVSAREWQDSEKLEGRKEAIGMPSSRGYPTWFLLPDELFDPTHDSHDRLKRDFLREYRNTEIDSLLELLVLPKTNDSKSRTHTLSEIRKFTKGAQELIVIDPYLLNGREVDAQKYLDELKRSCRLDGSALAKLHVIVGGTNATKAIKTGLKRMASNNNCTFTIHETDQIHDRIWIKDQNEAIVVGTSLGGIGNKLCFLLPLPNSDLLYLLKFLQDEGMLIGNSM